MAIAVGKEIVARWPNIRPEDHHGHHDLCPGRKEDVASFPFARVLRGIYGTTDVRDVWTPLWSVMGRQRALVAAGYSMAPYGADGDWGGLSKAALKQFQADHGLPVNEFWTLGVSRAVDAALAEKGLDLHQVVQDA